MRYKVLELKDNKEFKCKECGCKNYQAVSFDPLEVVCDNGHLQSNKLFRIIHLSASAIEKLNKEPKIGQQVKILGYNKLGTYVGKKNNGYVVEVNGKIIILNREDME